MNLLKRDVRTTHKEWYIFSLLLLSEFFYPLLGRARFRGRCWAAIRLSHHPEPSGHEVHGEVDGLDIGEQHGRWFVLLRHTYRPQRRPYPVCTSRSGNVRHRFFLTEHLQQFYTSCKREFKFIRAYAVQSYIRDVCWNASYCDVRVHCVRSPLPHAMRLTLNMHRNNKENTNTWKNTRIYTWR